MGRFIVSRLIQMVVVVIIVTFLAFMLVNLLPGNIIQAILGTNYTKAAAVQLTKELGLSQPLLVRYGHWLGNAFAGHLGNSLVTHLSVASTIWQTAGPSVELLIGAQLFALLLASIIAIGSVMSGQAVVDRVGTSISFLATSIPAFVVGILLLELFSVQFHLVPSIGWISPSAGGWSQNLSAMVLPCFVLALVVFPGYMRVLRNELYAELNSEYVLLARTKGISRTRLMMRHVVRNSLFGLITVSAFSLGTLVAGAVIIEKIFAIPGIAALILNGITNRDSTVVVGCVAVVAIFIGKEVFGGLGMNVFNPALVGRAFLAAAYPVSMTTWNGPARLFHFLQPHVDAATSATPLAAAKFDHTFAPALNMLIGQTGGSIGETSALLLALGGIVLIVLGIVRWPIVVSFLGSVFVLGEVFHLFNPAAYPPGLFQLLAGGLALGAFYMASDMVTSPYTDKGGVIFGIGAGVLVIIIRLFGGYPEGVMYAILLMNAVTPIINRYVNNKTFGARPKGAEAKE